MKEIYITLHEDNTVNVMHHMPFHEEYGLGKTKEELEQTGYFVEYIGEPAEQIGKRAVCNYDPQSNTLFYTYVDREETQEETVKRLLVEAEIQKQRFAQLSNDFSGFMDFYFESL